jgi:hypothetical protein
MLGFGEVQFMSTHGDESFSCLSTNDRIAFWTDAPPTIHQAHGNHGIARHLAKALDGNAGVLLTRKYRRSISKREIVAAACGINVQLYPDVSALGLKRIAPSVASALDILLFNVYAPLTTARIKRMGLKRVFTLLGADTWFLPNVLSMQSRGFETDLYLVDDIEVSARYGHNRIVADKARHWLQQALTRSRKVWAISEAFAEHLTCRFGIDANWLPIPSADPPPTVQAAGPAPGGVSSIVFSGGLNHLYLEPLRVLYEEIDLHNQKSNGQPILTLDVLTYSQPDRFLDSLPHRKWVTVAQGLSLPERTARMSKALALYLPYSFEEVEKHMVSTSFSCKLLEYFTIGRPILVYGPAYASIPRYFREQNLPFCATNRRQLREFLANQRNQDMSKLLRAYKGVWTRLHCPEAIRARIFA